jgi:hypothetical protein
LVQQVSPKALVVQVHLAQSVQQVVVLVVSPLQAPHQEVVQAEQVVAVVALVVL